MSIAYHPGVARMLTATEVAVHGLREDPLNGELTRESLRRDWLKPSDAARAAGISLSYLKLLGRQGKVDCLETPLGRLYKRADIERWRDERPRRGGALALIPASVGLMGPLGQLFLETAAVAL